MPFTLITTYPTATYLLLPQAIWLCIVGGGFFQCAHGGTWDNYADALDRRQHKISHHPIGRVQQGPDKKEHPELSRKAVATAGRSVCC